MRMLIAPAVAAMILTGMFVCGAAAEEKTMERTVTVSAAAAVAAEPDLARITSGVTTEAGTAAEALAANSTVIANVIDGLKAAGVDAKDIQTGGFNVDPRYTSPRDNRPPVIDGYRVNNEVRFVVRELKRLGEVLDQLVKLGANQIGGLVFEVSAAETLKDEARRQAIANARRRAELYAAAAGVKLGEVIAIGEDGAQTAPRPVMMGRAAMAQAVPVEAGSQQLEARVTVTWELK